MNIFLPHVCLEFEEPDLRSEHPACLPYVAAALACGWRLVKDGSPNHTDALHGMKHLQDFKHASPAKLGRLITFRFVAATRIIEGEGVSLEGFIARCQQDKAYFRAAQGRQWYERWLELLKVAMMQERRSLLAAEPEAHDRTLIVPMRGARPEITHRFAVMYENSWA
jgi:hypothetical protein